MPGISTSTPNQEEEEDEDERIDLKAIQSFAESVNRERDVGDLIDIMQQDSVSAR